MGGLGRSQAGLGLGLGLDESLQDSKIKVTTFCTLELNNLFLFFQLVWKFRNIGSRIWRFWRWYETMAVLGVRVRETWLIYWSTEQFGKSCQWSSGWIWASRLLLNWGETHLETSARFLGETTIINLIYLLFLHLSKVHVPKNFLKSSISFKVKKSEALPKQSTSLPMPRPKPPKYLS